MADTINVTISLDRDIKERADAMFNDIGLTFSAAVNLFAKQTLRLGKIPFELGSSTLTANGYTEAFEAELLAELEECHAAVANGAKTYKTIAELNAALDAEDDDE